ncbi:hypothetical protein FOZ62_023636 [Perkinsus olseni]|uniref:Uncharacterized protein n=1 Tax=Perkinsus olseni TaxID=32597 RepID=A0A7J6S0P5_PEROL|nr:hypothetical protein FOZ62_023636 [Perkinsus olseni]
MPIYGLFIFLCFSSGEASAVKNPYSRRIPRRGFKSEQGVAKEQGRCAVEARRFRVNGKMETSRTTLSQEVSVAWQASVGAVFDGRKRKYVIDYATLGEIRTTKRRKTVRSNWITTSTTKTLRWVTELAGLPLTYDLLEVQGWGCEYTIIKWGATLLNRGFGSVDKASAVLALAREAMSESRVREYRDQTTEEHAYMFGSSEGLLYSPLPAVIAFIRDDRHERWLESSIEFLDNVPSHDTIELPLLRENLDLMRAWVLPGSQKTHKEHAHLTARILKISPEWGLNLTEKVNDDAAVLALAKEALKDSRFREEHDNSTKAYLYVFGPPKSPLITKISFVRDALGNWFVNSIGLVDDVPSSERLVLPLYDVNLDRMRAWMLPDEDESDERDANLMHSDPQRCDPGDELILNPFLQALLPSAITYFRDDRLNRSIVNVIKFVDYTIPGGTIELPLLGKNLDIMRAWMLPEENDANLTDSILDTAVAWGIGTEEEGISEVEMETRLSAVTIAVAAGWHERLAPGN